tara:strand:+ start:1671 stop:2228 length:558 start_codon:yes stop_codon:yes gene_type:complete
MIIKEADPSTQPSFSLSNRLYRLSWSIIQNTLFKFSPRTFFNYRNFLLKIFGARIGKNTHIYNHVKIWSPLNLMIGNKVGIANGVNLYSMDKIIIEDNVTISEESYICTGTHDYESKNFQLYTKPIILKKNVWICTQCFIHPGVEIAEGCIAGARSVITKSINDIYTIYSGNPAKFIKRRRKIEI